MCNSNTKQYEKKYNFLSDCDQITDNIFLGSEDAAMNEEVLKKFNITAICTCGEELATPFIKDEKIKYLKYDIVDWVEQNIEQYFDSHYEWMEKMLEEGRNILIHCAHGMSRSPSFTIAYLMRKNNLTYKKAYKYVDEKRSIYPNYCFQ